MLERVTTGGVEVRQQRDGQTLKTAPRFTAGLLALGAIASAALRAAGSPLTCGLSPPLVPSPQASHWYASLAHLPPMDLGDDDLLHHLEIVTDAPASQQRRQSFPFNSSAHFLSWNDLSLCACAHAPPRLRAAFVRSLQEQLIQRLRGRSAVHLMDLGSGGMLQLAIQAKMLMSQFDTVRLTVVEPELPKVTCGNYVISSVDELRAAPRERGCSDQQRRHLGGGSVAQKQVESLLAYLHAAAKNFAGARVELAVYQSAGAYAAELMRGDAAPIDAISMVDPAAPPATTAKHGNLMVTRASGGCAFVWLPSAGMPKAVHFRHHSRALEQKLLRVLDKLPADTDGSQARNAMEKAFKKALWYDDPLQRAYDLSQQLPHEPLFALLDVGQFHIERGCSEDILKAHYRRVTEHLDLP